LRCIGLRSRGSPSQPLQLVLHCTAPPPMAVASHSSFFTMEHEDKRGLPRRAPLDLPTLWGLEEPSTAPLVMTARRLQDPFSIPVHIDELLATGGEPEDLASFSAPFLDDSAPLSELFWEDSSYLDRNLYLSHPQNPAFFNLSAPSNQLASKSNLDIAAADFAAAISRSAPTISSFVSMQSLPSFSVSHSGMPCGSPTFSTSVSSPAASVSTASSSSSSSENKRKRVKVACVRCYSSKVMCDQSRPCKRCVRLGFADQCVDRVHRKMGRPRKNSAPPAKKTP